MVTTLDWFVNVLVPAMFTKLDGWLLVSGQSSVSVLGIFAAGFIVWFVYRRFV